MPKKYRKSERFDPNEDIFVDPLFKGYPKGQQLFILRLWNDKRTGLGLPRVNPPIKFRSAPGGGEYVTQRPTGGGDNSAIPYAAAFPQNADAEDFLEFDDMNHGSPVDANPLFSVLGKNKESPSPSTSGSKKQKTTDFKLKKPVLQLTSTTTTDMPTTTTHSPMDTGAAPSDANKKNVTPSKSLTTDPKASGHNAASDGGFDSAQGPESFIDTPAYHYTSGLKHFKKIHHLKSFALPFTWLPATPAGVRFVATPMTEIPVQYMYFYMSEREFNLISPGSYVSHVNVSIQLISASTAFPTGGTTSTIATAQHPKICMVGYDLPKKLRGGQNRTLTFDNTIIPSSSTPGNSRDDFISKQYGSWQLNATWDTSLLPGTAYPITYNKRDYFCLYQLNSALATSNGFTAGTAMGHEIFNSCVTMFNMNDKLWDQVVHYSYKFKNAPVGERFRAQEIFTPVNPMRQLIGMSDYYQAVRNQSALGMNANTALDATTFVGSTYNNNVLVDYRDNEIEKGAANSRGSVPNAPARQPTLHIGMRQIPKVDVTSTVTRSEEFVLADMYFVVTAEMWVREREYPNRFTQPGTYNVSLENAELGTGINTAASEAIVTYGLKHT